MNQINILIRRLAEDDDVVALTSLIHRAYAVHLDAGLNFWGTHQTAASTKERLAMGESFIAVDGNKYVGTITVRPPDILSQVAIYRDESTWTLSQFAVEPSMRGEGLGKELHDKAMHHAASCGAKALALDTAAPAAGLIRLYESWGYRIVDMCDWRPNTNYVSVVMILPIVQPR